MRSLSISPLRLTLCLHDRVSALSTAIATTVSNLLTDVNDLLMRYSYHTLVHDSLAQTHLSYHLSIYPFDVKFLQLTRIYQFLSKTLWTPRKIFSSNRQIYTLKISLISVGVDHVFTASNPFFSPIKPSDFAIGFLFYSASAMLKRSIR